MGPDAKNANNALFFENFIDEPMLNVDPSRIGAIKVANQFFVGRRVSKRNILQHLKQLLRLATNFERLSRLVRWSPV